MTSGPLHRPLTLGNTRSLFRFRHKNYWLGTRKDHGFGLKLYVTKHIIRYVTYVKYVRNFCNVTKVQNKVTLTFGHTKDSNPGLS